MNVLEMVKSQLKTDNMDGLFNSGQDCGCLLDDDFAPCGGVMNYPGPYPDCEAGKKLPDESGDYDYRVGLLLE